MIQLKKVVTTEVIKMNAVVKLESRIKKVEVVKEKEIEQPVVQEMHEDIKRPEILRGTTYKITTPFYDHSVYITINDIILNPGTEYESIRPFEMFINSKNMENFQWIVALTRVISAVFRKGGEIAFLLDELKSVFDPRGGYYKPGTKGKFMNSLVAEIGDVLERHFKMVGILKVEEVTELKKKTIIVGPNTKQGDVCPKCQSPTLMRVEGCGVCTNCNYSACG
jgi:hypothetical protein